MVHSSAGVQGNALRDYLRLRAQHAGGERSRRRYCGATCGASSQEGTPPMRSAWRAMCGAVSGTTAATGVCRHTQQSCPSVAAPGCPACTSCTCSSGRSSAAASAIEAIRLCFRFCIAPLAAMTKPLCALLRSTFVHSAEPQPLRKRYGTACHHEHRR